ncbi:uncharacterized protein LOC144435412 [Glandiceps talaboti]
MFANTIRIILDVVAILFATYSVNVYSNNVVQGSTTPNTVTNELSMKVTESNFTLGQNITQTETIEDGGPPVMFALLLIFGVAGVLLTMIGFAYCSAYHCQNLTNKEMKQSCRYKKADLYTASNDDSSTTDSFKIV